MAKTVVRKLKNVKSGADVKKAVDAELTKLGLAPFMKCIVPKDAWVAANAPGGELDVALIGNLMKAKQTGDFKIVVTAPNRTSSTIGVLPAAKIPEAKYATLVSQLESLGF